MVLAAVGFGGGIPDFDGEGAGYVIPGTGVILNNFLGEEDILPPDRPWTPGDRMATSMCPVVVETQDEGVLCLGAAGSARR